MPRQIDLRRRTLGVLALGMGGFSSVAVAQAPAPNSPFVRLWATRKISVEIPRSWSLIENNRRIDIDAASDALSRRVRPLDPPLATDLPLAASRYVNNAVVALMNVRTYRDPEMGSQAEVRGWGRSDIDVMNAAIRQGLEQSVTAMGVQILRWDGTTRITNRNGLHILLSLYERSGIGGRLPVTVRLARVLAGMDSFTLTASYVTQQEVLFREVVLTMIESIRMTG